MRTDGTPGRDEVERFLARLPPDVGERMRSVAADVYRREVGAEPAAGHVDDLVVGVGRLLLGRVAALASEVTPEEWQRFVGEESARLGEGADEETLTGAVFDRALKEHPYLFGRRKRGRG